MKKNSILAVILLLVVMVSVPSQVEAAGFKELKTGIFLHYRAVNDPIYRETYGRGGLVPGLYISGDVLRRIELRLDLSYFRAKGEMTLKGDAITFTLVPVFLGLRYRVVEWGRLSAYMGVGLGYFLYREKLPPRLEEVSGSEWGYRLEGGGYLRLTDRFCLELHVGYTTLRLTPFDETLDLGGLETGVGFGYRF